jgi:hypothetical protein
MGSGAWAHSDWDKFATRRLTWSDLEKDIASNPTLAEAWKEFVILHRLCVDSSTLPTLGVEIENPIPER